MGFTSTGFMIILIEVINVTQQY